MNYPFEKMFSNFKYLNLNTELLEECGWDEEEYERISDIVSSAFKEIEISPAMSNFDYAWKPVENRLHGKISEKQISIIKRMILLEWDLIKKYYDSMEN